MANLRQDRVSGPTLSDSPASVNQAATTNGHRAGLGGTVLALRLLTNDSSGSPVAVSWSAESPLAALAIDIISASGGVPDPPRGDLLPSRFPHTLSALLAARRLQWALDGLAESLHTGVSASIVLHGIEDPAAPSIPSALQSLGAAQFILSPDIAETVHQVPGLAVGPAGDSGWRIAAWQSSNGQQNLAVDEQSVVELIQALGREDPVAHLPEVAAPAEPPAPARASTGNYEQPHGLGRTLVEPEAQQPLWKKPWLLIAAAGTVIVLAAVLVIPALISGNHSKLPAADVAPKVAPPNALPTPAPAAPRIAEKPRESKPVSAKLAKQAPKPEARTAPPVTEPQLPKPAAGSCDLTEGEIPRSLSRADSLMYAGKLEAAQDAYQRLLGCPSAHDKAAEGLRLVKLRIAAQSSSIQ